MNGKVILNREYGAVFIQNKSWFALYVGLNHLIVIAYYIKHYYHCNWGVLMHIHQHITCLQTVIIIKKSTKQRCWDKELISTWFELIISVAGRCSCIFCPFFICLAYLRYLMGKHSLHHYLYDENGVQFQKQNLK